MRFIKGMIIGGMVGMMVSSMNGYNMCNIKKKMVKKGKQLARKFS